MAGSERSLAQPIRVVHLDTGRTWRGGQQQVALLHHGLLERGISSRLLTPAGGPVEAHCRVQRLPVRPLEGRRPWQPAVWPLLADEVRSADLVHAHDSHAAGLAWLARHWDRGLLTVCHRRVSFPLRMGAGRRPKYRHVAAWIAVSGEIADLLRRAGVPEERIRVVPSAVDVDGVRATATTAELPSLRRQLAIPDRAPVVGVTAALEPEKGHRVLITAAPRVLEAIPDALFLCLGDGSLRRDLERAVVRSGVADRFRFAGFRPDAAAVTALFDVAVVPSVAGEGSSAALKEAMALGRAVVASELPGIREVAGGAALLVPGGDPGAIARAVVALLSDPLLRKQLGERAAHEVDRFRPERMVEATVELYRCILSGRRAAEERR